MSLSYYSYNWVIIKEREKSIQNKKNYILFFQYEEKNLVQYTDWFRKIIYFNYSISTSLWDKIFLLLSIFLLFNSFSIIFTAILIVIPIKLIQIINNTFLTNTFENEKVCSKWKILIYRMV